MSAKDKDFIQAVKSLCRIKEIIDTTKKVEELRKLMNSKNTLLKEAARAELEKLQSE